jgi:hypothetical protein
VEPAEGMLFMEPVKAVGDWLWHSDRIGNNLELAHGCLGEFVVKRLKGRMENISGEAEPIALCGSLLWMMIVAKAAWSLTPSFF